MGTNRKKILAICGSTKKSSTNLRLIKAIDDLWKKDADVTIYDGLESLPQFNPDRDNESVPEEVTHLRRQLYTANGVLVCTPEYAKGLPGTLKNAIDWTVSSGEFDQKPVAAITASTSGEEAHKSLVAILSLLAKTNSKLQLRIPFANTKISRENKITDKTTLQDVVLLIKHFQEIIDEDIRNEADK